MKNEPLVPLAEIASRLNVDRSTVRRFARKHGFVFQRMRTGRASNLTDCLPEREAAALVELRKKHGFGEAPPKPDIPNVGVFYVIQLVPELDAKRIKLGFAENLSQRLSQHRTAAPTARALRSWPCKRCWEQTVIDALTRTDCKLIASEVFECEDPDEMVARGEAFFRVMPGPSYRVPMADISRDKKPARPVASKGGGKRGG